jgi:hypothetical protein
MTPDEAQARVDEAESRAAEMERRYDALTVAMRDLEAGKDAEIARLALLIANLGRNLRSALLQIRGSDIDRALVIARMAHPGPGDLVVEITAFGAPRDPDSVGRLIRVEGTDPDERWVVEPVHKPGAEQGWRNAMFAAVPDTFPMTEFLAGKQRAGTREGS